MVYRTVTCPDGWTFTHVQQRMDEMGLTTARILEVLNEPILSYPGRPDATGRSRQVLVRDQLTVVITPSLQTVITVMWHGAEGRTRCGRAA